MAAWPQWRGPERDGICSRLPESLPTAKQVVWQATVSSPGIGGISANNEFVVIGSRDLTDTMDVFSCHRLADGHECWQITWPATGRLDYGNSPRATPLIVDNRVVLLGAFGDLIVADLESGDIVWQRSFQLDFGALLPTWGFSGSPIRIEGTQGENWIVVQPGAPEAALAAFDLETGTIVWQVAGTGAGYSSLVELEFDGVRQLVGYDEVSAGGWSLDGKRLWELTPPQSGDFNVPTPVQLGQRLFLTTENNGSRLYEFDGQGQPRPEPVARFEDLAPDTHSPVVAGDLICGTSGQLYCLTTDSLSLAATCDHPGLDTYTSAISNGRDRILFGTLGGDLILVHVTEDQCEVTGQLSATSGQEMYSHPALVGDRLLIRYGNVLECLRLPMSESAIE